MNPQGFPDLFYSKEPLPTNTILIKEKNSDSKYPKITWNNSVLDVENLGDLPTRNNYLAPYNDNDDGMLDCFDLEEYYEIEITKSGKYKTSFYVPPPLLRYIVGPKGYNLKQLQENTQTKIKVPKTCKQGEYISVIGDNERSVVSARNQISNIALSNREKLDSTHFISIPMNSDEVKKCFETFKRIILSGKAIRGVDESIFQNPNKMHLTITVLTLLDEFELNRAKDMLLNNVVDIFSIYFTKDEYRVKLEGLEIMNDDPTEVNVLYAEVKMENQEDQNGLQSFVQKLSDMYFRHGYVRKQYDIKLHVTLMNSKFRKDEHTKRETFDASFILDKHKKYYFGTTVLNTIDLSIRFTTAANGYYESEISVPLKPNKDHV